MADDAACFPALAGSQQVCGKRRGCDEYSINCSEDGHPEVAPDGGSCQLFCACVTAHDGIKKIHAHDSGLCYEDGEHDTEKMAELTFCVRPEKFLCVRHSVSLRK